MTADLTVLFDLDGVLVDTQDAEIMALCRFAESVDADIPDDFAALLAGRRMQQSIDIIAGRSRTTVPPDALAIVRRLAEEELVGKLRPVPGVLQVLTGIVADKYVVSNSPLEMIIDRLSRCGLSAHFAGPHFSAYEWRTWKPEPDLYRAALQTLAVDSGRAVAVEDSEVGVRAALGAGLRTCWYQPGQATAEAWSSAPRIFGDMADLTRILAELDELPVSAASRPAS
jgi:HAD superfamily hydrolase (TIGR01509 family)